jgi:peptidoglycan/LPS O-acetylase OafA/YrhL
VQEQFYLIWPVILRYVRRRYAVLFPLGFLLAHDATGWLHATGALTDGLPYRVLAGMDTPIYFGVLAAIALENRLGFRIGHAIAGRRWSLPLALAATLLPGWVPQVPQDLLALSITYLVVACALAPAGSARLLDNRAAGHVGSVSYGIYLLHMLALNAVRRVLPGQGPAVTFALAFPLAVLVSTASYRWFEQPILRLRERSPATRHGRHPAPPSLVVSATEAGR